MIRASSHPYKPTADMSRFAVVGVISNPWRFQKRYEHYFHWASMIEAAGVICVTVEQAFGDRPFMVTRPDNPHHVQVRTVEELWHKENMGNLGFRRAAEIVKGLREVAFCDTDIFPAKPPHEWMTETWHMLQHYHAVQMGSSLINLGIEHDAIGKPPMPSFAANYLRYGSPTPHLHLDCNGGTYPYPGGKGWGWPGGCWAFNVDALNKLGGLVDFCILGSGDWYMACGLIGEMKMALDIRMAPSQPYIAALLHWQELAARYIQKDIGCVQGMLYHYFHGSTKNKGYGSRGDILTRNRFNPHTDIKYDVQGLLQLETWEPRQIKLRDEVRRYFQSRFEDDTEGGR